MILMKANWTSVVTRGRGRRLCLFMLALTFFTLQLRPAAAQDAGEYGDFHRQRRINAHGDEFMSLAMSRDEKRLAVGTEKGEVIIWNNAERRVEKSLHQGSPVHAVAYLGDDRHLLAAGGPHSGHAHRCDLRKWDIETGEFTEFKECGGNSIIALAVERNAGLFAAATLDGTIMVWDSATGKRVAAWESGQTIPSLAFINGLVYVVELSREGMNSDSEETSVPSRLVAFSVKTPKEPGRDVIVPPAVRTLYLIAASPDGKYLAVSSYEEDGHQQISLFDTNGKEQAAFPGSLAAWISNSELLLFADDRPVQIISIESGGKTTAREISKRGGFHESGSPTKMMGAAINSKASKAWAVFQLNGSLVEFDLVKHEANWLIVSNSLPFAMDVLELRDGAGYLATGGDDKFVRVWSLADLVLKREFQVATNGVPQGVALLADAKQVVFSASTQKPPTEIFVGDLESGAQKKLLSVNQPFVAVKAAGNDFLYNSGDKIKLAAARDGATIKEFKVADNVALFAVSANGLWLAVADAVGQLTLFNLKTGESRNWTGGKIDSPTQIAVTNDGQFVYTTEFEAHLRRWDTVKQNSTDLGQMRGQAHCLELSADEKRIIIGGNHRDVGIYDAASGKRLFYTDVEASDFYVTNVWLRGTRLIYTTDGGVIFDGNLEH